MSEHTKEPWHVFRNTVQSEHNWTICTTSDMLHNSEANARRIVACVNELAGKPEGYVKQLESANAELVEALEAVHAGLIEHDWPMPHADWAEATWEGKLVAALAKHKGGGK